jgi:predicted CoA-binding protein
MRVAVIGASADRRKYGNKAVRSYAAQGHEVLPVNPHEETIEGLRCYKSVADIPGPVDRALLYVPPEIGLTLLPAIAAKAPAEVYVNPDAESDALFAEAARLGVNLIFACAIVDIGDTPARYP